METPQRLTEDWRDDRYVAEWITRQERRPERRRRDFTLIRAHIPYTPEQPFRYLNVGAGPGPLDAMLLAHFPQAQATLTDGSALMLERAREELGEAADRARYVQADFAQPDWTQAVEGPFDVVVSTIAIHNLFDGTRIRAVYRAIYDLLANDGVFLNLDYVRLTNPALRPLGRWAQRDPDLGFYGGGGESPLPGTLEEQVGWLREAGFSPADSLWREYGIALLCGVKGRLPQLESPG